MRKLISSIILSLFSIQKILAVGTGGFTNQVVSSKALGMGNVFVATADDPSAVFFNPAGLTQLNVPTLSIGFAPHFYTTRYNADNGTSDTSESVNPIVPNLYTVFPCSEGRWALALGIQFPFGLKTKWGGGSSNPLRYVATESKLQVLQINPTIAYQATENFSIGAGFIYARIDTDLKSKINLLALNNTLRLQSGLSQISSSADGNKELKGKANSFGYNIGVLYKFLDHHSVGANYRSLLKSRIKGKTELADLNDITANLFGGTKYSVDTEADLNLPQSVILGYAYRWRQWTFEVDTEWFNYAVVNQIDLDFKNETKADRLSVLNTGNPVKKEWISNWNFGFGTNYKFNDTWQVRGGYYYFPVVIPEHTWDPSVPDSNRSAWTLGGSYSISQITLDLAYNFAIFHKRIIHNTVGSTSGANVNGVYKTTSQVISLNLTYRFGK